MFTSVKYPSPPRFTQPLLTAIHDFCSTHVLPAVPPGILQKAFFKASGEQGEKISNEFGKWHSYQRLFFLVEIRFGLCFWETSHFLKNKILLPTWPGELLRLELFSVVSLSPLKCKVVLKMLDHIFKWNFIRPEYHVNILIKMKTIFLKKKNVYYKFKFHKLRQPLDLSLGAKHSTER